MDELARLNRLKGVASRVEGQAGRILADGREALPHEVVGLLEHLQTAAADVHDTARSSVKIGVVGEFSAGKTLLLGGIVGYADALPVSESPTTGNVTLVSFIQSDDDGPSALESLVLEFLDRDQVAGCLAFMLLEARSRAVSAQLPPEQVEQVDEILGPGLASLRLDQLDGADMALLRRLAEPAQLAAMQKWCRENFSRENPGLRYLIRELVGFVRAYAQCGAGICQSPLQYRFEGEDELRKAAMGLKLVAPERELQAMSFTDLPQPGRTIDYPPEMLTEDEIRAVFPLIRRVRAEVRVPRRIWDFAQERTVNELTGERPSSWFELLDFPGLGAESSGVRDLYLCLRELGEVQTILIVLNGSRPGSDVGLKLFDYMQKYRPDRSNRNHILVAVGRFDDLRLKSEGVLTELAKLAEAAPASRAAKGGPVKSGPKFALSDDDDGLAPAPAPTTSGKLTEGMVFERIPILKTSIAAAEALIAPGNKDRIVLTSALLYLKCLTEDNPTVPVGSSAFLAGLDQAVEDGQKVRKYWKGVADRLEEASPGCRVRAGLARWIDDFTADGGISRLRQVLTSHVQRFGVENLLQTVEAKRDKAKKIQQDLKARTMPPPGVNVDRRTWEDRLRRGRERFDRLSQFYLDFSDRFTKRPEQELSLPRGEGTARLTELLLEEVADEVAMWPQWRALLEASSNGFVREDVHSRPGLVLRDDDDGPSPDSFFPKTSENFYPSFETSLESLTKAVRRLLGEAVNALLEGMAEKLAAEKEDLSGVLAADDLVARIKALKLGPVGDGLVKSLKLAIDPISMKKYIFPEGDPEKFELEEIPSASRLFPLPRARRDASGRATEESAKTFAWASSVQAKPESHRPPAHHAHQSMVYRVRTEITTTLGQEMAQVMAAGLQVIVARVASLVHDFKMRLPFVVSEDRVLDEFFRPRQAEEAVAAAPAEDILAQVRQLASVEWKS